ncbi:MAG TPA: hypothetical protein VM388_12025 [Acidimicrobiales bacterium]|nr:hypothetical protein [Acidimicrobiales bacterium]
MSDTATQPDAIELLTADHAEVEQMFRQVESLPEGDSRSALVTEIIPRAVRARRHRGVVDRARDALKRD